MRASTRNSIFALGCAWIVAGLPGIVSSAERPANPGDVYGSLTTSGGAQPQFPEAQRRSSSAADSLRYWNQVAIDTTGLDHKPVQDGETRTFGEQLGPGRSARAMAIVHIAIYDAVNAIVRTHQSYTRMPVASAPSSIDAAIAAAAHDTLVAMYPSHSPRLDAIYDTDLAGIVAPPATKRNGVALGKTAAALILRMRRNDHSAGADPTMGDEWPLSDQAGHWRQDPVGRAPIALGAHWGEVTPFVLASGGQFRVPPPPSLESANYTEAFNEVKRLGGDGVHTPTERSEDQTRTGIYWGYDGTPSLCAPPRLYNQITTELSKQLTNVMALARLYALVNVSMADAGIAIWESKYYYDFWRPVTGIREADEGTGPTGSGDFNPATIGDPGFWPLGAPASNLSGPGFTPPFPSYPSGHAGFGGALFQTLRNFFGKDNIAFTFTSDEFNGVTRGSDGQVRPLLPRSFNSLSQAEEENGQSRIYLGIHWSFDKTEGIRQGRRIANYVFARKFRPLR